jgi:hypothetical protein
MREIKAFNLKVLYGKPQLMIPLKRRGRRRKLSGSNPGAFRLNNAIAIT